MEAEQREYGERPKFIMTSKSDGDLKKVIAVFIIILILTSGVLAYMYLDLRQDYRTLQNQHVHIQNRLMNVQSQLNELETRSKITIQHSESTTLAGIYKRIEPSVVEVTVKSWIGIELTSYGKGSGFVYDATGYIITNHHVIAEADAIEVTFLDGTVLRANLVGSDPYSDLAVIKVEPHRVLTPVVLGDSSELYVGETVLAIGNPFGLSGSMTKGIVSQLQRALPAPGNYLIVGVIQVDSAINPGNSGGPLINLKGEVVGVTTAIASRTGEFAGIGFTIPSNLVKKVVPSIIVWGHYLHPYLGISGIDVTPGIAEAMDLQNVTGFLITEVVEGSPAEMAGLRGGTDITTIDGGRIPIGGDVIINVDKMRVRKLIDLSIYLEYQKNVGDTVILKIIREGVETEILVTLGERLPP